MRIDRLKYVVSLLAFMAFTSVHAQVKVNATPTGKHADAINKGKQTKQTAEQRREQARKLKQQTEARQLYGVKYDSIKQTYPQDSLAVFTKGDSLAISNQILDESGFPPEYRELILNPISIESQTANADSVAFVEATRILEEEARKFLPQGMEAGDDPLNQLTNPASGLDPTSMPSIPSKPNPNLVKPDKARELFKKIDPEEFQDAQADVQKLKKKYSKLPDTRYPEEGTKRNSLEEVPFKKRLYFGGNIGLQSTDPVIINTNLQLGYWINKKWMGGVGIILREQFSNDTTASITGDGYGYSLFTRYEIPKGFFAWGEIERQINRSFFGDSEESRPAQWQSAYLLGIGREFRIGFVQMISMILYDFNYQNNDLNARPLVFRLGVRFSKKP